MALLVFQHDPHEDAGLLGQVLQSYGHRLRVLRLYDGQTVPPDLDDVDGVLSLGGPMNCDEADRHPWMTPELAYLKQAHDAGKPIVGLCLGHQLLATALGGKVAAMAQPEIGWQPVRLTFPGTIDPLLAGIPWNTIQFHMHGQEVTQPPPGAAVLASSRVCKVQAFKVGLRSYGFQYHFEWNRQAISRLAQDPFARRDPQAADAITAQLDQHYDGFRRLGERLSHNIAQLLFPLDKR